MDTVSIPQQELKQLQQTVLDLQKAVQSLQMQLNLLLSGYNRKSAQGSPEAKPPTKPKAGRQIPLKFGAGKGLITFMAEDFTAPLM